MLECIDRDKESLEWNSVWQEGNDKRSDILTLRSQLIGFHV